MAVLSSVAAGVILFTLTDLDDLLLLVTFFGDPRYSVYDVLAGQLAGMAAILLVSVAASLTALAIPPAAVGLLGLVPIGLGLRGLVHLGRGEADEDHAAALASDPALRGRIATVAAVTFSNGGDNIATYGPYLATRSADDVVLFGLVILGMTALWCAAARHVLRHRTIVALVGQAGAKVLPVVLIGLGLSILWRENTIRLLGLG